VLHCFDNIAYMARSEEGGDLPVVQFANGEYHVVGDLVLVGKERLLMYFKNALPIFKLLEGRNVIFLTPLPRYMYTGCCASPEHAPNRVMDEAFEESLRKGLSEMRSHFKDFLFTNNIRNFKLLNPGLCVPEKDEDGEPLWGEDPVHPLYGGYERIADLIVKEAETFGARGQKRPGESAESHSKRPRLEQRPSWVGNPNSQPLLYGYGAQNRGRGGHRGSGGSQPEGPRGGWRPPRGPYRGQRYIRRGQYY